jgi:hypothetical protein
MRYFAELSLALALLLTGGGGAAEPCPVANGDGDGSGVIDITDAIYLLNWLFAGGPAPFACPAQVERSGLPDTGQSGCYTGNRVRCSDPRCPGQDGWYLTGCPPEGRFTDRGDGTVADACTGLLWQKETADVDRDGRTSEADMVAWCEALAYVEALTLAGHSDWRLPNVRELHSIADFGRGEDDLLVHPIFGTSLAAPFFSHFWSSTSRAADPASAWAVDFGNGFVRNIGKDFRFHVRTVRTEARPGPAAAEACAAENGDVNADGRRNLTDAIAILNRLFLGGAPLAPLCPAEAVPSLPATGQTACWDDSGAEVSCGDGPCSGQDGFHRAGIPAAGRFVDGGDGTVTDAATGLTWTAGAADVNGDGRIDEADRLTWCEALAYCEGLAFAGHDDWRLPDIRELESLFDYGRSGWMVDSLFALGADEDLAYFWSSTSYPPAPEDAYSIGFFDDSLSIRDDLKGERLHLLAVRGRSQVRPPEDPCEECFEALLACGETATGALEEGDCAFEGGWLFDRNPFRLEEGAQVDIRLSSPGFDTFLFLEDSRCFVLDGVFLDANDDCGPGSTDSCIRAALPPGDYAVIATSYERGQTGVYTLELECSEDIATCSNCLAGTVECDGSVYGSLLKGACNPDPWTIIDVWRLELAEPALVQVGLPHGSDRVFTRLLLSDGACKPLVLGDCFPFDPFGPCLTADLEAGTYFVAFQSFGERLHRGGYELSVRCAAGGEGR